MRIIATSAAHPSMESCGYDLDLLKTYVAPSIIRFPPAPIPPPQDD
jgi:hypothetical protein